MILVFWILIVLALLGWLLQYARTRLRWEVSNRWSMCPYCHHRIEPGQYVAKGPRGRGHWTCV